MKTSEVLKKAKPYLPESGFVCIAALEACFAGKVTYDDYVRVRDMIEARLDGSLCVEGWLAKQGIPEMDLANNARMLDYRTRWMNQMITEFQAKGD